MTKYCNVGLNGKVKTLVINTVHTKDKVKQSEDLDHAEHPRRKVLSEDFIYVNKFSQVIY